MKTTLFKLPLLAIIALFTFNSCKKDYTCECVFQDPKLKKEVKNTADISKAGKKDAEEACSGLAAQFNVNGVTNTTCILK